MNNTETLTATRIRLFCRLVLASNVMVITWLATTGQEMPAVASIWDKANHFVAFLVLSALLDFSQPRWPFGGVKILLLLAYGLAIELVQYFLPLRYFSLADLLADAVGIVVYISLLPLLRRSPLQRWRYGA